MQLAPGGWRYVWLAIGIAVLGILLSPVITLAMVVVGLGILWFYRDPERTPPETGIVSPADGKVTVLDEDADGRLRVGVYMGPTNVHVNRAPLSGRVERVEHQPGGHTVAFGKDSEHNERVRIDLDDWSVVLIAGAFARRITPYVEPGETVERGERIGHIAFGSRADAILPVGVDRDDIVIEEGDRVLAGETVIATPD